MTSKHDRRGVAVWAVCALLAAMVAACGGDDAAGGPKSAAARLEPPPPLPAQLPSSHRVAPRWSEQRSGVGLYPNALGILVKPDGTEIREWGNPLIRRYVTILFARTQHAFLDGRYAEACAAIAVGPAPGGDRSECVAALRALDRETRPARTRTPLRFLWARTYPEITGLWVEDRQGDRFRIPFVERGRGNWRLDLDNFARRTALAMPLRGRELDREVAG